MALITGEQPFFAGIFEINDLSIANLDSFTTLDYGASPVAFGLLPGSKFVTGDIVQSSLDIRLEITDPTNSRVIKNGKIGSDSFSGVSVDVYSQDRRFIANYISNRKSTNLLVSSDDIASLVYSYTGSSGINSARSVFLDITSNGYDGNADTYHVLLNYPQVAITGFEIITSNPVKVKPIFNNVNYVKSIDFYGVPDYSIVPTASGFFEHNSGIFSFSVNYEKDRSEKNVLIEDNKFLDVKNNVSIPFNLVAIPHDYFYTGAYFLTSGIKTSFYSTETTPQSIDNIAGYVSTNQNIYDKGLDLQAVVKWDRVSSDKPLSFETYVYEEGNNNANYVFTSSNPRVAGISSISYGTGDKVIRNEFSSNYYSGVSGIFQKYSTSGIKWSDHTLFIDNYDSLPIGLYQTSKSLNYVTEVRVPAGQSTSPDLFFVYAFQTGNNSFVILPSGGQSPV